MITAHDLAFQNYARETERIDRKQNRLLMMDSDRDGVPNPFDCAPHDPYRHGIGTVNRKPTPKELAQIASNPQPQNKIVLIKERVVNVVGLK